ncbi:MAG: 50S ribosomal protein L4 [Candidatus Pacebacteria bacterium]|nr:50S ribosomal protein L4 [Candidatus Paceibacterota bacterium]
MESVVYDKKGKESGKVTLPESVFGISWNPALVQQVLVSQDANRRIAIAHAKDRSEVRGGGKKPWRQKGTGRARHGSTRSPIWVGGGATFGPTKDRNFTKKINKKMKAKALYSVLSRKLSENEILFVEGFTFEKPQTKEAKTILSALAKVKGYDGISAKRKNALLVVMPDNDSNFRKSFSNFGNIEACEARNLNVTDLMKYKYVLIVDPKSAVEKIEK